MPRYSDPLKEAERIIKATKQKGVDKERIEDWQKRWRERGPVKFAEQLLTCPLDVPPHPDFDPENNPKMECGGGNDCPFGGHHSRFRKSGIPYHIILSDDEKELLHDLATGKVTQALVAAARGTGKTFCLAIWNCWLITCRDHYKITCMGGSSDQSDLVQEYIDDWRIDVAGSNGIELRDVIHRSLKGIKHVCHTVGRSICRFTACSTLAARGKHVNCVEIDEACEAEDKSEDGAKAVAAVQWQTTGKSEGILILTSTAHYIHGMFYEYMTKPEFGFKVYQWALAKHISGESDPLKVYTDKDPNHWLPNVWWITKDEVANKRRTKSDEEWLCEALGGASMASGAVFQKKDLDVIICGVCDECEPYVWGKCPLTTVCKLGTETEPTKHIIDRKAGFDYGVSDAPCALTVVGVKGNTVFVLYNDEQLGIREEEKVMWIEEALEKFETFEFIPDPAAAGKHLNEPLEDKGYSTITIPEQEKAARVANVINFVEKHKIIIPKAFWYLTQSLRKLAWKDGKIRKAEDHSFDSLQYAMSDYQIESEGDVLNVFLEFVKTNKQPKIDEVYGVK